MKTKDLIISQLVGFYVIITTDIMVVIEADEDNPGGSMPLSFEGMLVELDEEYLYLGSETNNILEISVSDIIRRDRAAHIRRGPNPKELINNLPESSEVN